MVKRFINNINMDSVAIDDILHGYNTIKLFDSSNNINLSKSDWLVDDL